MDKRRFTPAPSNQRVLQLGVTRKGPWVPPLPDTGPAERGKGHLPSGACGSREGFPETTAELGLAGEVGFTKPTRGNRRAEGHGMGQSPAAGQGEQQQVEEAPGEGRCRV